MKYLFELAVAGVLILSVGSASVAQAEVPADRRIYRYCYSHDLKTKTVRYSQVFPADIHKRAETRSFQHEEDPVIEAPHDECPIRPVPQAAEEKDEHEVEVVPPLRAAIAAERDVEVVAEPA